MTDPKIINYYVFLTLGIGSVLIGVWTTYIAVFESHHVDRSLWLRDVFGGPALIIIGAYLIYFTMKHRRTGAGQLIADGGTRFASGGGLICPACGETAVHSEIAEELDLVRIRALHEPR